MMTAPKLLAIILVALYLQFYHTKVLLVQTHDGSDNAPKESIKSRVPSQIKTKTSKLKTKSGQHRIQNKALGLPADLLPGPDEKPDCPKWKEEHGCKGSLMRNLCKKTCGMCGEVREPDHGCEIECCPEKATEEPDQYIAVDPEPEPFPYEPAGPDASYEPDTYEPEPEPDHD